MPFPVGRKLVVEFIGTFFFVFTVCMATNPKTGAGALAPLAIGSALMVMVFAGGHISGAHYNPAVSTAVLVRGKMLASEWLPYVVIQLVAAVLAALVGRALSGHAVPVAVAGIGKILIVEFLFTFALAYVVLNVATARGTDGNSFYGLAIGFTVVVGAYAVGGISSGAFNPAIALGETVMGLLKWGHYWVYLLAELLGGLTAGYVFLYVQPGEKLEGDVEQPARPGGVAPE
jgi:aquaporin Z